MAEVFFIDTELPSVFEDFVTASDEVYSFLVEDHGFESLGWEVNGRECTTWFTKRPNVTVMFSYEPMSTPMGNVFARLRPVENEMVHKPMQDLARQRIPGWKHPQLDGPPTASELRRVLTVYADLLREHFPEVLIAPDGFGVQLRKGLS